VVGARPAGIAYDFANGDGEHCPIGPEDWRIIKKLGRKGALARNGRMVFARADVKISRQHVLLRGGSVAWLIRAQGS
jgi:hypothetical protein